MNVGVGTQFQNWVVIGVNGRRATCQCRCGNARVLSCDAIADGSAAHSCGCSPLSPEQSSTARADIAQYKREREIKRMAMRTP